MLTMRLTPVALAFCAAPLLAIADDDPTDAGNRYDFDGIYASEISASAAYLATIDPPPRGRSPNAAPPKAVILDVRTIEEYLGGHPKGAYSIPYPHVYNRQRDPEKPYPYVPQDSDAFVDAVDALGLNKKNTLIITMCRTGARSVGAASILTLAGYENVQNMWEGFVGRTKVNTSGDEVDLDGDGFVTTDPYSGDLDGWANFAGLPIDYEVEPELLFQDYLSYYFDPLIVGER